MYVHERDAGRKNAERVRGPERKARDQTEADLDYTRVDKSIAS